MSFREMCERLAVGAVPHCTGVAAYWCPIHGSCTCEKELAVEPGVGQIWGERRFDDPECPLHGETSQHAEIPLSEVARRALEELALDFPPSG